MRGCEVSSEDELIPVNEPVKDNIKLFSNCHSFIGTLGKGQKPQSVSKMIAVHTKTTSPCGNESFSHHLPHFINAIR